jgi:hypothetical protein
MCLGCLTLANNDPLSNDPLSGQANVVRVFAAGGCDASDMFAGFDRVNCDHCCTYFPAVGSVAVRAGYTVRFQSTCDVKEPHLYAFTATISDGAECFTLPTTGSADWFVISSTAASAPRDGDICDCPQLEHPKKSSQAVLLLSWTPVHKEFDDSFRGEYVCGADRALCIFTRNRAFTAQADALLFHVPGVIHMRQFPQTRDASQQWVLFSQESPSNWPMLADDSFMGQFQLTATYRADSAVPLPYLDFAQLRVGDAARDVLRRQGGVAWIASNCADHNGRLEYVREMMKHVPVDSYGGCLHNKNYSFGAGQRAFATERSVEHKLAVLRRYKFTLAFENSDCDWYATEKLQHAFEAGTVPVVMGAPNLADMLPADNSVIDVRAFESPSAVSAHLNWLLRNHSAYLEYFAWRIQPARASRYATVSAEARADSFQCRLCNAVRNRSFAGHRVRADRSCKDSAKRPRVQPLNPLPLRNHLPSVPVPLGSAKQRPVPLAVPPDVHGAAAVRLPSDMPTQVSAGRRRDDVAAAELIVYRDVAWPDPAQRCIGDACSAPGGR